MPVSVRAPARVNKKRERIVGVLAIATIGLAWWAGLVFQQNDITQYLFKAMPRANRFETHNNGIYAGYDSSNRLIGYVGIGEATGYGGPMQVAVGINPPGNIVGVAVVNDRETPAYLRNVLASPFYHSLVGKPAGNALTLGNDLDVVSGATYTARAIADATRQASRQVARLELGQSFATEQPPEIHIGVPEITIVLLYLIGFIGHRRKFKYQKQARWFTLIAGLVVLGFLYNVSLTLSHFNALLLGYFPMWQTHLYWYLLLGGLIFVFTVDNKNPYCEWFCPFGAAQECAAAIGRADPWVSRQHYETFRWLQRGLAWLAIVIALLTRNPGITSYEVFSALFRLLGSNWQFVVLGIALTLAMGIKRPWCNFLCPIRPVTDFIRLIRGWIIELWQTSRT